MNSNKLSKNAMENLLDIGRNVASLWGAECHDAKPDDTREVVVFHCMEHGEKFITEIAYNDLDLYIN